MRKREASERYTAAVEEEVWHPHFFGGWGWGEYGFFLGGGGGACEGFMGGMVKTIFDFETGFYE